MVFHSRKYSLFQIGCCHGFSFSPLAGLGANIFALTFWDLILYKKLCPFINKWFSIDSFHDWKGRHWVFFLILSDHSIRLFIESNTMI